MIYGVLFMAALAVLFWIASIYREEGVGILFILGVLTILADMVVCVWFWKVWG